LSDVVGETPPYSRKFHQAERHSEVLEAILSTFVQRHPYEVRQTVVDGPDVNRFHFTEDPDPEIPLIVGDTLFNLRSGFDHVIAALVKPSHRRNILSRSCISQSGTSGITMARTLSSPRTGSGGTG
jgi:hypothetical protein